MYITLLQKIGFGWNIVMKRLFPKQILTLPKRVFGNISHKDEKYRVLIYSVVKSSVNPVDIPYTISKQKPHITVV